MSDEKELQPFGKEFPKASPEKFEVKFEVAMSILEQVAKRCYRSEIDSYFYSNNNRMMKLESRIRELESIVKNATENKEEERGFHPFGSGKADSKVSDAATSGRPEREVKGDD